MSFDNPEDLNYDFNYNLFVAKQGLSKNLRDVKERHSAVRWMKYLSTCTNSLTEMKLRNDFMYYLVVNIQNYCLQEPFTSEPPVGLLTQHQNLLPHHIECHSNAAGWDPVNKNDKDDEIGESARPLLYQYSPDGGAFLASQPIPRCGAFCYLAVVSQSKES